MQTEMISACCSERRLVTCVIVASIVKAYVLIMAGIVESSLLSLLYVKDVVTSSGRCHCNFALLLRHRSRCRRRVSVGKSGRRRNTAAIIGSSKSIVADDLCNRYVVICK